MHSNAIQQILDESYIDIVSGSLQFNDLSRWNHILIILAVTFIPALTLTIPRYFGMGI